MRKVKAIIERASDGNYSIYMDADDMSYLVTGTGKTVEEALKVFQDGYEDMKQYYAETGKKFEEVEFEYQYDVASFLQYYAKTISLAGLERRQICLILYRSNSCTSSDGVGSRATATPFILILAEVSSFGRIRQQ